MSPLFGRTGIVGWYPTDTDECVFAWYSELGITKDGSNRVSSWIDQKNGYELAQATDDNKMIWTPNELNGYPGLISDFNDDFMKSGAIAISQPLTLFVIAKDAETASTIRVLVDGKTEGGAERVVFYGGIADTIRIAIMWAGAEGYGGSTGGVYKSWTGVFNGASSDFYLNGSKTLDGVNVGTAGIAAITLAMLWNETDYPWKGGVVALVGFNAELSSLTLAQLFAWSLAKYGI